MVAAAVALELPNLVALVVEGESAAAGDIVKAVFALDDVSEFDSLAEPPVNGDAASAAVVLVVRQVADFEHKRNLVVVQCKVGVRGFAVVIPRESAADAHDALWHIGHAEEMSDVVRVVRRDVAHVTVAVSPDPVPVVVQPLSHQWAFRAGAAPKVIIDAGRDRSRAGHLADRLAVAIPQ